MTAPRNPFLLAALAAALAAAPAARAGLRFRQVPTLPGAEATALASDGTNVWAATPRGVWKLASGAGAPDGLGGRTVLALAAAPDGLYAADGTKVWRRGADGSWAAEALPASVTQPSALATDGASVWAAGLGVAKKSGGAWTALAAPGGKVFAAAVWSGDLVAGLRGNVARYTGASVSYLTAGMPATANVQALASVNGLLYAGTDQTLYSWSGAAWVAEPGFGLHDVRAITNAGGVLRAATADAGILRKSGSWATDNSGVLPPGARSFAAAGSDLYAGTGGGPVYRLLGSSWAEAGTGLWAATISDVAKPSRVVATARGAGIADADPASPSSFAPEGCGDVRAVAPRSASVILFASNCGVFQSTIVPSGSFPWGLPVAADAGLPAGVSVMSLSPVADGSVAGGTTSAGMWRFVGFSWSADNGGLSGTEPILAVRPVGSALFASTGASLFSRQTGGWRLVSGAPPLVQALGGDASLLFAAPAAGISAATLTGSAASAWRSDEAGANSAFVSSLDTGSGMAFAAGGTSGVLRKKEGGWQPENAGLPDGVDVRVARVHDFGTGHPRRAYAGTAGNGLYVAEVAASTKLVPVVLDVIGATGSRFRSDLTLGSKSDYSLDATITYAGAPDFPGSGGGSTTLTLAPHTELRIPDALQFLRDRGVPVGTGNSAGSLSVSAFAFTDDVYAFSRTYTADANGSYGVFLDGPSDLDAAEDSGAIYGLRSVAGISRSNLALAHVPAPDRSASPITLSVQVFDQSGAAAGAPLLVTLLPGEWKQLNGVLLQAGLAEPAYGYAKITRTSGLGAWTGYGVVNDAKTSDGSILPLYRPGGLAAARRLVVPVVLDVYGNAGSHYTTELTLANDGAFPTPVDLFYKPSLGSSTGVPFVTLALLAGQQTTIPDVMAYLRSKGLNVPDGSTGPQAGTLTVEFRSLLDLDAPRTVAIARTTTPNPNAATGGAFGVAYAAAAKGGGARASALVPGLSRDAAVRSNLAVVHLGGRSESALSLSAQLYDAGTAQPIGSPLSVTLLPGDWVQWSGVFDLAGVPASVTKAYAVVTRVAGDDTWLAYGVLNDAQTSDGSFIRMIPAQEY